MLRRSLLLIFDPHCVLRIATFNLSPSFRILRIGAGGMHFDSHPRAMGMANFRGILNDSVP